MPLNNRTEKGLAQQLGDLPLPLSTHVVLDPLTFLGLELRGLNRSGIPNQGEKG